MPTFHTPNPIEVDVAIGVGDVHVITSERTDTMVAVRPADANQSRDVAAADDAHIDLADGRLIVRVERGKGATWLRSLRTKHPAAVEVTVEAPDGRELTINTQMGHIYADGQFANSDLRTGMGNIRADGTFGNVSSRSGMGNIQLSMADHVDLKLGTGDIEVAHATGSTHIATAGTVTLGRMDGPTTVRNASGPIRIKDARGPVRANSSTSDVALTRTTGDVVAKSSSGSVSIDELVSGNVVLRTAAGNVRAGIAEGTAVHLDLATNFGRVHNDLTATDTPTGATTTAALDAKTSAGDIEIQRVARSQP